MQKLSLTMLRKRKKPFAKQKNSEFNSKINGIYYDGMEFNGFNLFFTLDRPACPARHYKFKMATLLLNISILQCV